MSQVSNAIGGQYEAQFKAAGIPFEFVEDYPISSITVDRKAQVRRVDVAPAERVKRYQEQMKNEVTFPPLTVRHSDGALIDGSTRLAAMVALGKTSAPVYRVQTRSNEEAQMLGGQLNQLGGKDLDKEDLRRVALTMDRKHLPAEKIGRRIGVSAAMVTRWKAVEAGRKKAEGLGVEDAYLDASQNVQEQLAKVIRNEAFTSILDVVGNHKPVAGELKQLVKKVNDVGTDAEALEAIDQTAQAWPEGTGITRSPAMGAAQPIGMLVKHDAEHWVDVVKADTLFPKWEALAQLATAVVESYIAQIGHE